MNSSLGTNKLNNIYTFLYKNYKNLNFSDMIKTERPEQELIAKFLPQNSIVLELGGSSGTTAVIIDKILKNPLKHVVVEPAKKSIQTMKTIKKNSNSKFHIIHGFLGKTRFKQEELWEECKKCKNWSLKELENIVGNKFNVLVVDCEGAFLPVIEDFPELLENARLIIIEFDGSGNNNKVKNVIKENGFDCVHTQVHPFWNKGISGHNIFKNIIEVNDLETLKTHDNIIGFHEVWIKFL